MSNAPLMPKATAVWLVDNTALTFDQVADFTKMHPLEVRAIADGDAAQGIKGMDPISTGQLTRDEIEKGEGDPNYRLRIAESKVTLPPQAKFEHGSNRTDCNDTLSCIGPRHRWHFTHNHGVGLRERVHHGVLRRPRGVGQILHYGRARERDVQFRDVHFGNDTWRDDLSELLRRGLDAQREQPRWPPVRISAGSSDGQQRHAEYEIGQRRSGRDHQRDRIPRQRKR